jgi:hypothetical protein
MNPALERRIRERRARVLVRSWDYRQRRHARGMWFRLRRVLADANAAFAISCEDATRLIEEGYRAEPVGDELEPPKRIVFTRAERVAQIATARAVPVGLGPELLEAECLALTPFETPRP